MDRQARRGKSIPEDWRDLNRANWDERVAVHIAAPNAYNLDALRAGSRRLDPIATDVLGPVAGKRVLHLQCHFGMDTLVMARQGASATGLDFSSPAIAAAKSLAAELGLSDRARFIEADIYDALTVLPEHGTFDRVFVSWGALCWLPDILSWARIIATFLNNGGFLALAEAHPFMYVFDSNKAAPGEMPVWCTPYLEREALVWDQPRDYADPTVLLRNSRTCEWLHPISDVITALIDAGLRIDRFQEHDSLTWRFFDVLEKRGPAEYVWPNKPWLPLSYSLRASKP
jgi:SAM-dependent methyltransferase